MTRYKQCLLGRRSVLVAACLASGVPIPRMVGDLEAQSIRGRLLTAFEDQPIERGRIELLSLDGGTLAFAVTDAEGRFMLRIPGAGRYRLRGEAALHESLTEGPVEVQEGQTVDVEFRLPPQTFALDTVDVSVARRSPRLASVGFYDRAREGHGYFLTQEEIERRNARDTSDLLSAIPGVQVETGREPGPPRVFLRGRASIQGGTFCVPAVYIDGFLQANDQGRAVNDIRPEDIAGLELYTSQLRVPPTYAHGLTGCGVILIWTRAGRKVPDSSGGQLQVRDSTSGGGAADVRSGLRTRTGSCS